MSGIFIGQGNDWAAISRPQTPKESPINRFHKIAARTSELSKKIEVLDPVLRIGLGVQDTKQMEEVKRKLPPLYDEIGQIADSLEYSLRVI